MRAHYALDGLDAYTTLAGLCADLSATRTTYPGTNLTLVYTVKDR